MVSTFPPRKCGIGDYAWDLVHELVKRPNISLTVLTYDDNAGKTKETSANFDIVRDLEIRTTPGRLRKTLRALDPDAIHFQSSTFLHSSSVNRAVARGSEMPLVVTTHDVPQSWRVSYTIPSLRSVYDKSSRIVTLSREVSRLLIELHEIGTSKLMRIPIGVDTGKFSPDVSDRPFRNSHSLDSRRIVLFFGFLRPGKGIEVLLDAWRQIEIEFPDALLLIAGGVPSRTRRYGFLLRNETYYSIELESLAKKLGVAHRVLFANHVPEELLPSMFSSATALVLPYVTASQSAVLPKALGSGRPLVATRIPGFLEFVRDGESALLTEPGDADSLVSALRKILTDSGLANQLGRNGREIAVNIFSWPKVAGQIAQVYSQLSPQDLPQRY
jgi:glycosyltransferase involved in cell wall biosynthesis